MKIIIETIPHEAQRYPTVGDWYYEDVQFSSNPSDKPEKFLRIRVSKMGNPKHEEAAALHELFEALACAHAGISQEQVDTFDKQFELDRVAGKHGPADEPGCDPRAPYSRQHLLASGVEHIFGGEVGIDWNAYANEVESMP